MNKPSQLTIVFIFFHLLSVLALAEKKSNISGIVRDAETGKPIFSVNLFLANTTIGTASQQDGSYLIRNIPPGSYDFIIHHIGYEMKTIRVQIYKPKSLKYNFTLTPRVHKGEEIAVLAPKPKEWRRNLAKFSKIFLGLSPNASKCKIKNPEVLNFTTNKTTNEFIAFSDSILCVENRALGYRIYILIREFRWKDQIRGTYRITPRFEELEATDEKEYQNWLKNRQNTYDGSFRHFLSAIAREKVFEDNFRVYMITRLDSDNDVMVDEQKFVSPDTLINADFNLEDNKNISSPDMLVLFKISFPKYLKIIYQGQKEKTSWIKLKRNYALVDTLGNIYNAPAFSCSGYWAKKRVADLLPFDFSVKVP